jgi:hypothetical protein
MGVETEDDDYKGWAKEKNGNSMPGSNGAEYQSGWAKGIPCPGDLANRANAHTEQKFARDLIDYNKAANNGAADGLKGKTYNLNGTLPPCPTCHNAMRKAAEETGATINYSWGEPKGANSMTYSGKSAPVPTGQGQALVDGGYNDWSESKTNKWGVASGEGAQAAYEKAKGAKPDQT